MSQPRSVEGVLAELRAVATAVGPALAPVGSREQLQDLVDAAREAFEASACSIALLDEQEDSLVFTVASGAGAAETVGLRVPVGAGIAGWVVSSGQAVEVADVTRDARFARDVAERTGYLPRAILAAPLETERSVLGVIEVLDRGGDRPGAERDLLLLGLLARHAALAVEASRTFGDMGRALLHAAAAASDGDLAAALESAADRGGRDAGLIELAELFARLGRLSQEDRELAVSLVAKVVRHVARVRRQ